MKKVIILLMTIFLSGCMNKGYTNISYSELEEKINNNETFAFVIGSRTCSACQMYKGTMEKIIKDYGIQIYFIELDDISEEDDSKLRSKFSFQYTPTTIFIENGSERTTYDRFSGAVGYSEVVERLKDYNIIEDKTYTKLSYNELEQKMNNNETFAFVIGSKTCSACKTYKNTMRKVIEDYDITIYSIELEDLNESDSSKLRNKFSFQYTPTTVFIENGSERTSYDRFNGAVSYSDVISRLKSYNIIKG